MNVLWDTSKAALCEGSTRTYDVAGRLLTKQHSVSGQTSYEWDGWDCVREFAPGPTGTATFDGTYFGADEYGWDGITNYYVVNGVLWSVDFGGTCAVVADAQGHVRTLVDPNSNTVFSTSYNDPWGTNPVVTDDTPGFYFRYVGAAGVRADTDTGLTYMRQRWYSGALQRFVSRDMVRRANRYTYAANCPTVFVESSGRDPVGWTLGQNIAIMEAIGFIREVDPEAATALYNMWQSGRLTPMLWPITKLGVPAFTFVNGYGTNIALQVSEASCGDSSLDPCKLAYLVGTLMHESRHVNQAKRGVNIDLLGVQGWWLGNTAARRELEQGPALETAARLDVLGIYEKSKPTMFKGKKQQQFLDCLNAARLNQIRYAVDVN